MRWSLEDFVNGATVGAVTTIASEMFLSKKQDYFSAQSLGLDGATIL
jgi:hypothetical protein